MREIKFRGLRTDNSQMIVGQLAYFFDNPKNAMIMPKCYYGTRDFGDEDDNGNPVIEDAIAMGGYYSVKPETVGQFTGLHDKNGLEIYEGDVVKIGANDFGFITNGNNEVVHYEIRIIECDYILYRLDLQLHWGRLSRLCEMGWDCEILGNIHENPELI